MKRTLAFFVTDNYGLTELTGPGVSGECEYRCGLHFAEDAFLPEIIDSATGERKAPGESESSVVTTLLREGMPVLRYRTKDITRLNYEPCRCGRTHVRMDKVTGRTDDMMIIKGVNVSLLRLRVYWSAHRESGRIISLLSAAKTSWIISK